MTSSKQKIKIVCMFWKRTLCELDQLPRSCYQRVNKFLDACASVQSEAVLNLCVWKGEKLSTTILVNVDHIFFIGRMKCVASDN